jgi:hypothetical protein
MPLNTKSNKGKDQKPGWENPLFYGSRRAETSGKLYNLNKPALALPKNKSGGLPLIATPLIYYSGLDYPI